MQCTLCQSDHTSQIIGPLNERYYHCYNCQLIFANPYTHLTFEKEKARYELHQNSIDDKGYVSFLNNAIKPALPYLNNSMRGLDYGCGPNPTLSKLLKREGINCDNYDPYFFPGELKDKYDFIFSTETFEHFRSPDFELNKLSKLLNPDGLLIVMTGMWGDVDKFKDWHYPKDPTHVSFYNLITFKYIQEKYGFKQVHTDGERVMILCKR